MIGFIAIVTRASARPPAHALGRPVHLGAQQHCAQRDEDQHEALAEHELEGDEHQHMRRRAISTITTTPAPKPSSAVASTSPR